MENGDILQYVKYLTPLIISFLSRITKDHKQEEADISSAIERHLTEVNNWANVFQFFGMVSPLSTDSNTIPLDFFTEPRIFQATKEQSPKKQENDLIEDSRHYLLLGEPGSGKTTTIKRVSLTLLKEPPSSEQDFLEFPVVIRLRELQSGDSLCNKLSDILGLIPKPYEVIKRYQDVDSHGRLIYVERKVTEMRVGNYKLEDIVPQVLNETKALLLLDGLDELHHEHRISIRDEIIKLSRQLTDSKIIVSCRSGDYNTQFEGFSVIEICPLTETQILTITGKWLGDQNADFLRCLRNLPYFDVANRPLLLTQLLLFYKRYKYLPDQPTQMYSKLVDMLLQQWDAERDIHRESRYSGFDPSKKAEFLSSLAYKLTYPVVKPVFTERDLAAAYLSICDSYKLPKNQAVMVAREIQTHTGIISAGPQDTYEFCHLSLQEYLCGQYIVKSPLETQVTEYLSKYAAPLAVAVALSSTPGSWFGNLILQFRNLNRFKADDMNSLLSRILVENPNFEVSEIMGFAIIFLFRYFSNDSKICDQIERLLQKRGVLESCARALKWYVRMQYSTDAIFIHVKLNKNLESPYRFSIPKDGAFPKKYLKQVQQLGSVTMYDRKNLG